MKLAILGATGLVGSALVTAAQDAHLVGPSFEEWLAATQLHRG